jgi:nucleotide-binding universal stress UspA family protein
VRGRCNGDADDHVERPLSAIAENSAPARIISRTSRSQIAANPQRSAHSDRLDIGRIFARTKGMITIQRLLVATDFGAASDSALRYGRELARIFGAELHVLHVTENILTRVADSYSYIPADVQEELEADRRRATAALLDDEDRRDLRAVAVTMTSNAPAEVIVEYARTHRIGLIVMGTHGRGAIARWMLGSVAERVVRAAPCPVLTVHNPEQEFVYPDALVRAEPHGIGLKQE